MLRDVISASCLKLTLARFEASSVHLRQCEAQPTQSRALLSRRLLGLGDFPLSYEGRDPSEGPVCALSRNSCPQLNYKPIERTDVN